MKIKNKWKVQFLAFMKAAATGMYVGRPYRVYAMWDPVAEDCPCDEARCEGTTRVSVRDDELTLQKKRELYDLRRKIALFTVVMLNHGLYITDFQSK